nr:integrase, catalytic region, zinc finger, CCHC-type, peptidase aspartic, catalytic [Tanacetum cinerariifolium]
KSGIQCYNCKEYGHIARECQKPKRAKDAAYHREKMLLCKQEEAGIQLNAEQADWRDDTDDESDDQELEAHYMYMAKLQQVSPDVDDSGPIFNKEPEEKLIEIVLFIVDSGVKSRTKMPIVKPVSTREPKRIVNQSVAKPLRKTVASESNQKPRNTTRKLYEHLVEIILFIVDSGCSKHMMGNLNLLINFVEKFLGTVKFGND